MTDWLDDFLNAHTRPKWSELFPDGRTIFYEGDDPKGFVIEMKERFGFDPSKTPNVAGGLSFPLSGKFVGCDLPKLPLRGS